MKLRFGIDAVAHARIRARLDAMSAAPKGRRLSDVYLDTPDGELAAHGVALRFRSRVALDDASAPRPRARGWRRQEVWSKAREGNATSLKKLGIPRLKQRLDATFTVRIERWTWQPRDGWAVVSLSRGRVSTGEVHQAFDELRIVCKRKRAQDAMRLAVELGAVHRASLRARDRGRELLAIAA